MTERELFIGTPEDNFRLIYSRSEETAQILEFLEESSIVFFYSAAGNGKTAFGVEFRERVPNVALILGSQIGTDDYKANKGIYDNSYGEASIIIADEFGSPCRSGRETIDGLLSEGKKFIFMTHFPKSRYIKWREQHQEFDPLIMGLIRDYPNAPWLHLSKWKDKSKF